MDFIAAQATTTGKEILRNTPKKILNLLFGVRCGQNNYN